MIKSLYTIGSILRKDEIYAEYFEPWENPFPKVKDDEAKIIYASVTKGVLQEELGEENFSHKRVRDYLFREAKARATNLVPTFYLQKNQKYEKYINNVRKIIDKIKASINNYNHAFISETQIETIGQKLINQFEYIDPKKKYLFTIKIDNKFFGEFSEFRDLFIKDAYEKYYNASSSSDKLCSVTYKPSKVVWGRVSTLGFTVNDITFSRNGFDPKDSYKMFPVSPEVVKTLEGMERIIFGKLTKEFYGLKFFILPHFICGNEVTIKNVVDLFIDKATASNNLNSESNGIISNENIIKEITTDKTLSGSDIYYDIFFYQKNQEQIAIKLHLSDVLPSRLKIIFKNKESIERYFDLLTRIPKSSAKNDFYLYRINFSNLREFFYLKKGKSQNDWIPLPIFYSILEAVFCGTKLNQEEVIRYFIEDIRTKFRNRSENEFEYQNSFKRCFAIYHFLSSFNLYHSMNARQLAEQNIKETIPITIEEFLESHMDFYNTNYKKGIFLLGCLVQRLLRVQMANLNGNKPFEKELNNLIINGEFVEIIYRKVIDKLRQHKISYSDLEIPITHYLSCNEQEKKISKDKISFIFTSGLVMETFFKEQAKLLKNNLPQNK